MPLKDRISFLSSPADVDAFLTANPTAAIFKAGTCHKTQETFTHVQAHLDPREDLKLGVIKVVEARPASNHVAALTGIEHESPQIILFKDGRNVFDRDNWDITSESVAEGLKTVSA
jgi:bacillithiol system protein YtxJ